MNKAQTQLGCRQPPASRDSYCGQHKIPAFAAYRLVARLASDVLRKNKANLPRLRFEPTPPQISFGCPSTARLKDKISMLSATFPCLFFFFSCPLERYT